MQARTVHGCQKCHCALLVSRGGVTSSSDVQTSTLSRSGANP